MRINYKIPPKEFIHGLYCGLADEVKYSMKTRANFQMRGPEHYKLIYSKKAPCIINKTITSPLLRVMFKE